MATVVAHGFEVLVDGVSAQRFARVTDTRLWAVEATRHRACDEADCELVELSFADR